MILALIGQGLVPVFAPTPALPPPAPPTVLSAPAVPAGPPSSVTVPASHTAPVAEKAPVTGGVATPTPVPAATTTTTAVSGSCAFSYVTTQPWVQQADGETAPPGQVGTWTVPCASLSATEATFPPGTTFTPVNDPGPSGG